MSASYAIPRLGRRSSPVRFTFSQELAIRSVGLARTVVACTAVKPVPLDGVTVLVIEAIVAGAAGKYVYTVCAPQLIVAGSPT
jgi:hypothetical protein